MAEKEKGVEYFTPKEYFGQGSLIVRRKELKGVLIWWELQQRRNRWYRRLWRWLRGRVTVDLVRALARTGRTEVGEAKP